MGRGAAAALCGGVGLGRARLGFALARGRGAGQAGTGPHKAAAAPLPKLRHHLFNKQAPLEPSPYRNTTNLRVTLLPSTTNR